MDQILEFLKPFLESVIGQAPFAVKFLIALTSIVGTARLIFKPLSELTIAIVGATPTKSDDEILAKLNESKVVKVLKIALNYLLSIKIPEKK